MAAYEVMVCNKNVSFELNELVEYTINTLKSKFNRYFSSRALISEIIMEYFKYPSQSTGRLYCDLKKLRSKMSCLLSHIYAKLKDLGYIRKYNNAQWIILKPIDISPEEIYSMFKMRR